MFQGCSIAAKRDGNGFLLIDRQLSRLGVRIQQALTMGGGFGII